MISELKNCCWVNSAILGMSQVGITEKGFNLQKIVILNIDRIRDSIVCS